MVVICSDTDINKHLMTGLKGNCEFCFSETLNVTQAKPSETMRVEGKQNSVFPLGSVIKCFVLPPNSKIERKYEKMVCLTPTVAVLAVRAAVKPSYATETTR